jgi:hypothetical protein
LAELNTAQAAITKTFPDKMEIRADLVPLNDLAVHDSRTSLVTKRASKGRMNLATTPTRPRSARKTRFQPRNATSLG